MNKTADFSRWKKKSKKRRSRVSIISRVLAFNDADGN